MSVGAATNIYAGVPGLATLGLGVTPPASAAPKTPPTTPTPSPPATTPGSSVAGFTVLGIQGNGKPTTPVPKSTGPNVYQQAYDGITTAANNYLQDALFYGPGNLPLYAAGSSAGAFAALSNTLAALKTGLSDGFFKGTGFNSLA